MGIAISGDRVKGGYREISSSFFLPSPSSLRNEPNSFLVYSVHLVMAMGHDARFPAIKDSSRVSQQ